MVAIATPNAALPATTTPAMIHRTGLLQMDGSSGEAFGGRSAGGSADLGAVDFRELFPQCTRVRELDLDHSELLPVTLHVDCIENGEQPADIALAVRYDDRIRCSIRNE